jgi:hypothetical protein
MVFSFRSTEPEGRNQEGKGGWTEYCEFLERLVYVFRNPSSDANLGFHSWYSPCPGNNLSLRFPRAMGSCGIENS